MGATTTAVYQIGRLYFINSNYYQVIEEHKGKVKLKPMTTIGKTLIRTQQHRTTN